MKRFLVLILTMVVVTSLMGEDPKSSDGKFIFGNNMKVSQDTAIDINTLSKEKMLGAGISSSYVNKIVEYRELTGGFNNLEELKRISGIGEKTYEKLAPKFKIGAPIVKKKAAINKLDEKKLELFGFTTKEIKAILEFKKSNGAIRNNMDLMKILTKERYEGYRDGVDYSY